MQNFRITWRDWDNLTHFYCEGEELNGPLIYYAELTIDEIQFSRIMNPNIEIYYNDIHEIIENHQEFLHEHIPHLIRGTGVGRILEDEKNIDRNYLEYYKRIYYFISRIRTLELPVTIPLYLGLVNEGNNLHKRIFSRASNSPHPLLALPILSCGISTNDVRFFTGTFSEENSQDLELIEKLLISHKKPYINLKDLDFDYTTTRNQYEIENIGQNPFNEGYKPNSFTFQ